MANGVQMGERGMSKKQQKATGSADAETPSRRKTIEPHRHCPICWNGNGGYGSAYSKHGRTTYYKCDQVREGSDKGPCGHTWTAVIKIEAVRVEHRVVNVDGER